MKKLISMTIAMYMILLLGGCNTVSGFGEDLRTAGGALKESAEKTKEKVSN